MIEFNKNTLDIYQIFVNKFSSHLEGEQQETQVLVIDWECNLGFGRYELYFEEDGTKIKAYSEYMDSKDDKTFLKALLEKVLEMTEVIN